MKNGKDSRFLGQMLGLTEAPSIVVQEQDGITVRRYTGTIDAFCRVELSSACAPFVNGITQNLSRLMRRMEPVMQLESADERAFYAYYVEPCGNVKVGRHNGFVATDLAYRECVGRARSHFRFLEQRFAWSGLRLECMTLRFGKTTDGRVLVSSLFDHRDWVVWQGTERLFAPEASVEKLTADYKRLEAISTAFD